MTDIKTKTLGILLSAIMVLSVFAMPVAAQANLNLSGSDATITQGTTTVDASFTLENTGDESASGPAVEITGLPDGWSIDSVSGDGGTVSSDQTQVLYLSVGAGSSVNPTWTLNVPSDAATGTYTITGNLIQDGSTTQTVDITVTVEAADGGDGGDGGDSQPGDANLDSGGTFWQGQELYFDASSILSDGASSQQRTFQIRRVTGDNDDRVGNLVDEFTVDSENLDTTIDTDNLDGFYVVTHPATGKIVSFEDGTASLEESTSQNVANQYDWEVAPQSITTEFDSDDVPVLQDETATLEVSSNRGAGYIVNITAENLDEDDLSEIWGQDQTIEYTDDDEDLVGVRVDDDEELEANFSVFDDAGSYSFTFEVADTTASDTASLEVQEKSVDINFAGNGVFSQQVGDEAEITVELGDTDTAYIFIGGQDVNFLERVEVVDDDGNGQVTLEMNTFNAHQAGASTYDVDDDDDQIESVTELSSDDFSNEMDDAIDAQPLDEPLERGDYDITVSSSSDIEVTDDGSLNVPDETDVGVLDLTRRQTTGIQTWVAPTGQASEYEDAADLLAGSGSDDESDTTAPTQGSNVALSDRLIVQVQASGLYGYLEDDTTPTDAGIGSNGLDMSIEETEESAPANSAGGEIDLSRNNVHLYTQPAEDQFFVVVDMRKIADNRIDDGDELNVSFSVYGPDDEDDPLGAVGDDAPSDYGGNANPYVKEDGSQTVETEISVEDADADFDNLVSIGGGDEELQVPSESGVQVSGTSNLAPGTELTIRLRATGDTPFFRTQDVTVTEDGSWSGTFDMSDIPTGVEFDASIRKGGTTLNDVDGAVVEEVGTPTPTPPPTPEPETVVQTEIVTASPAPSPTPQERTVVQTQVVTRTVVQTPTETPGQPGFGVTVAIVALLAAALLALRRRD